MELLDIGIVAETIGPPAGDEVHAVSFHIFQKFPAPSGSARELGGFFSFVFGFGRVVSYWGFNRGD